MKNESRVVDHEMNTKNWKIPAIEDDPEWGKFMIVPIGKLSINHNYQRDADRLNVKNIVEASHLNNI